MQATDDSIKPQVVTTPSYRQKGCWLYRSAVVLLLLASGVLTMSALLLPQWRYLEHGGSKTTAASGLSFRKIQISPWKMCMTFDVTNDTFKVMRGETCYSLRSRATLLLPSPAPSPMAPNRTATYVDTLSTTVCDRVGSFVALLEKMGVPSSGMIEYDAADLLTFACGSSHHAALVFHIFAGIDAVSVLVWAVALMMTSRMPSKSSFYAKLERMARITVPVWLGFSTVLAAIGVYLWVSAPGHIGVALILEIAATVLLGVATAFVRSCSTARNDSNSDTDAVNVTPRQSDPLV